MDSFVGRAQDTVVKSGRRRKITLFVIISIACIIAASGIFYLLVSSFMNKKYTSYKVVEETGISANSYVKYLSYCDKVLKYSRDGISVIDASGKTVWNGSYDMLSPAADICGEYTTVADIGSKSVYVYNGEGQGREITTDYPIVQASVSAHGVVAVLIEQANSNVINIYAPYDVSDKLLVEIPTNVDEGYPVCIDISPAGTNLVSAFVSVTSGKIQARAAFYDFTDVGKNTNCLVGAKNYNESIISDVRFLGNDNICIFTDKGFSIWNNAKQPGEVYTQVFDKKIKSAFCNDRYVGMVFENNNRRKPYQMKIYDLQGKKILDIGFGGEYSTVRMYDNDEIMFNSASQCMIFRINGVRKLMCRVDGKVSCFLPAGKVNKYYLVMENKIQKISLENKK